ncbi:MAG: hypothetical protein WA667_04875 [Candidatus Nitrosopolaris sp.]
MLQAHSLHNTIIILLLTDGVLNFPSDWLVGHNTITGIDGTKMSENASKFIPFDGQYSNISVNIGITSRVNRAKYKIVVALYESSGFTSCLNARIYSANVLAFLGVKFNRTL